MKKITALFLPLAAAFLSAGCTQENFSQLTDHNALIFTVSIADATRTSLQVDGSSGKVSWTEGDEILINGVAYTATPDADNPGFATFTKKNSADAGPQTVDGNANDAYGVTSTTLNGKQYYLDQHYGKVLDSQDGYITLNNLTLLANKSTQTL